MPFYNYVCKTCGFEEEALRCIADRDTEVKCPDCEKGVLVRELLEPPQVKVVNPAVPRRSR